MNSKKLNKRLAHAEFVFQREQLKAATMNEQLDKAFAVVEQHKDELSDEAYKQVLANVETRREEIKEFLLKATEKYAKKLKELGDPTLDFGLEDEDLL